MLPVDVAGEVSDEVLLREPDEAALVREGVGQGRGHRPLRKQRAERLALVEAECRDVDEAHHIRGVGAERSDDLSSV